MKLTNNFVEIDDSTGLTSIPELNITNDLKVGSSVLFVDRSNGTTNLGSSVSGTDRFNVFGPTTGVQTGIASFYDSSSNIKLRIRDQLTASSIPPRIESESSLGFGLNTTTNAPFIWYVNGTGNEKMRLTPTGLEIANGLTVNGLTDGILKSSTGVLSGGNFVALGSDVSGTLPIANGGTNSTTALTNDRVIVSSAGAITESATITTTELGLLNGIGSVSTGVANNDKFVTQGYVDDQVVSGGLAQDQIYYYGDAGSDANTGLSVEAPLLTPGAAAAKVVAQTPSSTNQFEIRCIGAPRTSGNITIPTYTTLNAPASEHSGTITFSAESKVILKDIIGPSSAACVVGNGANTGYLKVNRLTVGTSGFGIDILNGFQLRANVGYINAFESSATSRRLQLSAVLFLSADTIRENSTFIKTGGAAEFLDVKDNGTTSGTDMILYNEVSDIKIHADGQNVDIDAQTVFIDAPTVNVDSSSTIDLNAPSVRFNISTWVDPLGFLTTDNIGLKVRQVSGTTPAAGGSSSFALGVTAANVNNLAVVVDGVDGRVILENDVFASASQFGIYMTNAGNTFTIRVNAAQTNVASRAFRATIWYKA